VVTDNSREQASVSTTVVGRPPFNDTHVHLWNLDAPDLSYEWLQAGVEYPLLGRLDRIRAPLYDARAFRAESRFAGVGGVILVEAEAARKDEDPVVETQWLAHEASLLGIPAGIVVHTDLSDSQVDAALERHCATGFARGVRDFTNPDKLMDAGFRRGYARLARYGLVYDLDSVWDHLASARKLAEAYPDVTMVVEHVAFPQERTDDYFRVWQRAMSDVAGAPNAVCKISGLGMGDPDWTPDSLRPWVEHAILSFGATRCFFGTNWPVDRMYSSYDALIAAYDALISGCSSEERSALFFDNAARVYRTPSPDMTAAAGDARVSGAVR
jgi:predicted TIM-barrel fold metal-dependent hydrolase